MLEDMTRYLRISEAALLRGLLLQFQKQMSQSTTSPKRWREWLGANAR